MFVTAIIAAGGRGSRFGGAQPKQLIEIGGEPMLARSVRAFAAHPSVDEVIVALPEELTVNPPAYLRDPRVQVVAGGARRQDSVGNGFRAASGVRVPVYTRRVEQGGTDPAERRWCVVGDRATLGTGERQRMYKDLARYIVRNPVTMGTLERASASGPRSLRSPNPFVGQCGPPACHQGSDSS